jgi:hypothetical protein
MPLLDHFRPPVENRLRWESFHSNWATRIADALNDHWLPQEFFAEEYTHGGSRLEIDVATYEDSSGNGEASPNGSPTATLAPATWAPPEPPRTMPGVFPDSFEVRVFTSFGGVTLVGAIELISPGNKDRPAERRAFAIKCASYLYKGVSVVLIDVVTTRRANLHNEILRVMEAADDWRMPADGELYAVAYRPVLRQERPEIDFWTKPCQLGQPLPTLPLRLTGDTFVPIDFESTYQEARRHRRGPKLS